MLSHVLSSPQYSYYDVHAYKWGPHFHKRVPKIL